MHKRWKQIFAYLLSNSASDPVKQRKGQILSFLLMGTSLIWIVIGTIYAVELITHPDLRNEYIFRTAIVSVIILFLAWSANRRGRVLRADRALHHLVEYLRARR